MFLVSLLMEEIWKDVVGFEGRYKISNTGKLFSIRFKRLLTGPLDEDGYRRQNLCNGTSHVKRSIHRLVAIAFIPNPNNLPQVNHIDGNKLNNTTDNLEWCTRLYNQQHQHRVLGVKYAKGERIKSSKLKEADIIKIRELCTAGVPQAKIGKMFGVRQSQISRIKLNTRWQHLNYNKTENI